MNWFYTLVPILSSEQLLRLANIFDNAGQVVLGVIVLTPIINTVNQMEISVIIGGIILAVVCWTTSLLFTRLGAEK